MKIRTRIKRAVRAKTITPAKRRIRSEIRKRPLFECGSCGKSYSNPFGHQCSNAGDFGKRKRAQQRAGRQAAAKAKRAEQRAKVNERVGNARRAERHRANQRVSAARQAERRRAAGRAAKAKAARKPPRTGRPAHDDTRCRDHDCTRQASEAYREGLADGEERTQ